jgi:hypothetical protein
VITASSVPIASPHRAGHHSGLHPEDLPYLSSQIEALHFPERTEEAGELVLQPARHDPEQLVLPPGSPSNEPAAPGAPTIVSPAALDVEADLVTLPSQTNSAETWKERPIPSWTQSQKLLFPRPGLRQVLFSKRSLPNYIAVISLLLLVAGSLLTFRLINHSPAQTPAVTVKPDIVHIGEKLTLIGTGFGAHDLLLITYDSPKTIPSTQTPPIFERSDANGSFSKQIDVPAYWTPGPHIIQIADESQPYTYTVHVRVDPALHQPPTLRLSTTMLNFTLMDTITDMKIVTLSNGGNGQLTWQAESNAQWIMLTPSQGSITQSTDVRIAVDRSSLGAGQYTGMVTFKQIDGGSIQLNVTLTVG